MAHKWAHWLRHPCRLGGRQPLTSGNKIGSGPQLAGLAIYAVANPPPCGPLLILSPTLRHWGSPQMVGGRSQSTHLWAIVEFVPRSKALGTTETARVALPMRPLVGHY